MMVAEKLKLDDMPRILPGFEHVTRHWDRGFGKPAARILPGQYYVTTQDEIITTVLGSCISVCIRDTVFGIGGMNHFMLPAGGDDSWDDSSVSSEARYGGFAMERLINEILKHGGSRRNLELKIFGGGKVLQHATDVGRRNIEFIRDYVVTESLRLVAEDVGDIYPRKVLYFPVTGLVRVRKLMSTHEAIAQREKVYLDEIGNTAAISGNIDLF